MAEQLKNVYTKEYIKNLALKIKDNYKEFDADKFINSIFDNTWESLELKARMRHIAINLDKRLALTYDKQLEILKEVSSSTIDSLDAIRYEDFKKLIDSRGSFRIAFEDIMFSTKVAIENKDDFFDFVTKLIDNDFNSTAYTYLDGFNEYFSYDKEIEKLYKKLEEKKIAVNHK